MRIALFVALLVTVVTAGAQSYPSHPVKVIVPWPPGQAFVIDNRPGAGGSLGTAVVATSPADGYTLLAASSGPISIMPSLQKLSYDPLKDFVVVGLITRNPYALVVNPSFPAKNAKEFVELLRRNPDKYTFASSG